MNERVTVPPNKCAPASCRYAAPLSAGLQFGHALYAQPWSPAAVAHLWRQASSNVSHDSTIMLYENDIIEAVCSHLQSLGFTIESRCRSTERGDDIVASHSSGLRVYIER